MTPNATNITPDQRERPVVRAGRWDGPALSWRRNSPKRLTAKPTPIKPSPVRIQARKVRSAAKYTLGSCSAGLSMEGIVSARCACRNSSSLRLFPPHGEQLKDAIPQLRGIEGRPDFHVVVEIDKDITTRSFWRIAFTCSSAVI